MRRRNSTLERLASLRSTMRFGRSSSGSDAAEDPGGGVGARARSPPPVRPTTRGVRALGDPRATAQGGSTGRGWPQAVPCGAGRTVSSSRRCATLRVPPARGGAGLPPRRRRLSPCEARGGETERHPERASSDEPRRAARDGPEPVSEARREPKRELAYSPWASEEPAERTPEPELRIEEPVSSLPPPRTGCVTPRGAGGGRGEGAPHRRGDCAHPVRASTRVGCRTRRRCTGGAVVSPSRGPAHVAAARRRLAARPRSRGLLASRSALDGQQREPRPRQRVRVGSCAGARRGCTPTSRERDLGVAASAALEVQHEAPADGEGAAYYQADGVQPGAPRDLLGLRTRSRAEPPSIPRFAGARAMAR